MSQCEAASTKTTTAPPAPPPNSPSLNVENIRPTTPPPTPLSEKTKNLIQRLDTVEPEDLMSREEKMERADRSPIPPGAKYIPGGMEVDSDEDENYEN